MRQVSPSFFVRALSQCGKQNVQENRGGEFIKGVAIERAAWIGGSQCLARLFSSVG